MEDNHDQINRSYGIRLISLLSIAHAGIDFICAFSLYHSFVAISQVFLLYNFCAFALQLPIGVIIDKCAERYKDRSYPALCFTLAGIILTCLGAYLSPLLTGLGNALFHSGGGILTINEDDDNGFKGRGLGVFVAPGALGLILGSLYYGIKEYYIVLMLVQIVLLICGLILYRLRKHEYTDIILELPQGILSKAAICFLVVVLRSLCGMAIIFPWKNSDLRIVVSVLALALGKTAGGFLGARFGLKKTIVVTLSLAALAYCFADNMVVGILALFLFNMTMPLTLYLLAREMKNTPGMVFGILTFGLFIGYLPVLYGYIYKVPAFPLGSIASLLSLILLLSHERIADGK